MTRALALALAALAGAQAIGDLRAKLADRDARARQDAVRALARLDTLEAWKLVVGALADPIARVADEAQLQVAGLDGDAELALLAGKDALASRNDVVRARVAEAAGRLARAPDAKLLATGLRDASPEVRRMSAWSVERLARAASLAAAEANALAPELERAAAKDKDAGVRAAAVVARAVLDPPQSRRAHAEAALASKDAEVRSAGVLVARDLEPALAFELAKRACADPAAGVRVNAADALAALGSKRAALALVEQLEAEKELRPRWRVAELLQRLSGLAHRLDARPWRAWAEALPGDWKGEPATAAGAERDLGEATAAFVGLPILSERVAFLIDLSGSMWMKRDDGTTRKDDVDRELASTLQRLAPSVEFNLIPYVESPVAWQPELSAAKPANVAKALEFFAGRRDSGSGDLWEALELALADPRTDTIVVLSDGAPSGGVRWNIGLMRRLFAERNRFRRVALDAVLTDPTDFLAREWQAWCAEQGGRCVRASMR